MDDRVDTGEHPVQDLGVAHVADDEVGRVGPPGVAVDVGAQAVEDDDLEPGRGQGGHHCGADEPGTPGDQHATHGDSGARHAAR